VDSEIVWTGFAAASAVEAGHGLAAAGIEGLAEDVFSAGFDWFSGWHVCVKYPIFLWGGFSLARIFSDVFLRGFSGKLAIKRGFLMDKAW
jgi:hypothetical protein